MKAAVAATGIHSMTGFAQAHVDRDGCALRINLRSVNHRYLDLHLRMPDGFEVFESPFRHRRSARLATRPRGRERLLRAVGGAMVEVNQKLPPRT